MSIARRIAIACTILTIGLTDAILKGLAINSFQTDTIAAGATPGRSLLLLALHKNPGIAFNIPVPLAIVLPITLIVIGVFVKFMLSNWGHRDAQALSALAAIIGALGNGLDRLINGFTTDYLLILETSAINLSDVLILLGIAGVLWYDKYIPSHSQRELSA